MPDESMENLVKRYGNALDDVKCSRDVLNKAECELSNSITALGKRLMPSDVKVGEKFGMWVGGDLLQIEYVQAGEYRIEFRSRKTSAHLPTS